MLIHMDCVAATGDPAQAVRGVEAAGGICGRDPRRDRYRRFGPEVRWDEGGTVGEDTVGKGIRLYRVERVTVQAEAIIIGVGSKWKVNCGLSPGVSEGEE